MPKSRGCICDVVFGGIKRSGETVGLVPFNLAPIVSAFLKRSCNKGLVEVTGNRVIRGAGYGLEIPCKYHVYGSIQYRTVGNILPLVRQVLVEKANLYKCARTASTRDIWGYKPELNIH